jgi:hypothetical protein
MGKREVTRSYLKYIPMFMGTFISHPFLGIQFVTMKQTHPRKKIMGIREVIGSYFIPRKLHA